jgi:hypothetical protein
MWWSALADAAALYIHPADAVAPIVAIREANISLDALGIPRHGEFGALDLMERIALLAEQRDTLRSLAQDAIRGGQAVVTAFEPLRIEVQP